MVSAVFGAKGVGVCEHPAVVRLVSGKSCLMAKVFVFTKAEFAGYGLGTHGAAAYGVVHRFCAFTGFSESGLEEFRVRSGQGADRFGRGNLGRGRLGSGLFTAGREGEDREEEGEFLHV